MRIRIAGFAWLFILCFPLGSFAQVAAHIKGKYHFESVSNQSNPALFAIASADTFILREDGTFFYAIQAKNNLAASGTWEEAAGKLILTYKTPTDTVRTYTVTEKGKVLRFAENGVTYTFTRDPISFARFEKGSFQFINFGRGLLGMFALLSIAFLFSANRKAINWMLVLKGLALQFILAIAILKVPYVEDGFDLVGRGFVAILGFTREGSLFLFGNLISDTQSFGYIFAFQVLPTVVFFSALTSLLYYYNILQKVVYVFAWIMKRTLKLSGAESLAAAGNIFLGQTESPLLIKPYIKNMTRSELLCLMTGGMATIAGGVLAAYIGYLGGPDEASQLFFARHLLAASVMSAPAAIVAAKMLLPEKEKYSDEMKISRETIGSNWLDAIAAGTTDGLRLAINVGAMLLVFTAMIYMFNAILGDVIGAYTGLNDWVASVSHGQYSKFSLQFILGYGLAPLTWLLGVNGQDITVVGQLLGEKTILNEFYAYVSMGDLVQSGAFAEQRSVIIATYILCGFANFASIGIQIGGIAALAPTRRSDLSALGIRALIGGTIASLFTAVIVGMLI
jgi:CNT family concentrative nucleoside transporter